MSTKIAYATLAFTCQAGPVPVELIWEDAADAPSHGIVLWDETSKHIVFAEFDEEYTAFEQYTVQYDKWGRHGGIVQVELLHPNDTIIALLRDKLHLTERHLTKLKEDEHRKRLETVVQEFFLSAQHTTEEKKRDLTWAELKTLWDGQAYVSFQKLEMEMMHNEDDLQRLFDTSSAAYARLEQKVTEIDQVRAMFESLQAEIRLLKRPQTLPRSVPPPPPVVPQPVIQQIDPSTGFEQIMNDAPLPPQTAVSQTTAQRATKDCRTWYLLLDRYGCWDSVIDELYRAIGVNPYYQRTPMQGMAFRWF